jgi:Family of unknown function (DUF6491)
MHKIAPVAFLFGLLAASPALARDDCVFLRSIDNFNVINDQTLIVYTSPKSAYRVNLFSRCQGLPWAETIAIDSHDGLLCSTSRIIVVENGIKYRCPVDSILAMAPADIEKLKKAK